MWTLKRRPLDVGRRIASDPSTLLLLKGQAGDGRRQQHPQLRFPLARRRRGSVGLRVSLGPLDRRASGCVLCLLGAGGGGCSSLLVLLVDVRSCKKKKKRSRDMGTMLVCMRYELKSAAALICKKAFVPVKKFPDWKCKCKIHKQTKYLISEINYRMQSLVFLPYGHMNPS